nr:MAG: capsid protein [Picornaviridae sp.]
MIGWHPEEIQEPFDMVNADPWLFDLSTGGTHLLTIPFSNITKCYDVRRGQSMKNYWGCVPKIYLTNLVMTTLAKSFSSTIHVKGRFSNMTVWGQTYLPADISFSSFPIESQMSEVISHSNPIVNAANVVGAVSSALGKATVTVGAVTLGISKYKEFYKTVSTAWGELSTFYDDTMNIFTGTTVVPTDSTDKKEVDSGSPQNQNQPTFFGGMNDVSYSPKENLSVTMKRIIPHGLADKEAFHNVRSLAQIPCLIRCGSLKSSDLFYEGVAPFPCEVKNQEGTAVQYSKNRRIDYLSQFSQYFRYWRGGIKYSLTIHTSPLITARIVIQVVNNGAEKGPPSGITNANLGAYVYKKHLEVTGFYKYDFVVPFVFMFDWAPIGKTDDYDSTIQFLQVVPTWFSVRCNQITSGLSGTAADPEITYNLFRSGADDIQFRNFAGVYRGNGVAPPAFKIESQMKVRTTASKYENICRGSNNLFMIRPVDEDVLTVETLLHRWSYRLNSETGFTASRPYGGSGCYSDANVQELGLFDYLLNQFRYVRGNVQLRIPVDSDYTQQFLEFVMAPPASVVSGVNIGQEKDTSAGSAFAVPGLNPVLDIELPIESYSDWWITYPSILNVEQAPVQLVGQIDDPYTPLDYYVKAGRAFQIAYLNPPFNDWNQILNTMTSVP